MAAFKPVSCAQGVGSPSTPRQIGMLGIGERLGVGKREAPVGSASSRPFTVGGSRADPLTHSLPVQLELQGVACPDCEDCF